MRDRKRDTDVKNRLLDSVGEGENGMIWGVALKHVYYHIWNRSPVQVWCMRQGARDWCTGMTLRDGMGREVGGGFRMGNTCTLIHINVWQNPPQYCKELASNENKKKIKGSYPNWKGRGKTVIICIWHETLCRKPLKLHTKTIRTDKWIQQVSI